MARKRLISIGFFENEDLAQLPDKARLLFAGLWLLADRAGRLEDRPLRIRGQVFPYEIVDCDVLLAQLADRGFIRRYGAGDQRIIVIPKFLAHQNPHVREPESKLPAFSQCLGIADARTVPAPDAHSSGPAVLDPVTDPVTDPVKEPSRKARASKSPTDDDPLFAKFWQTYPNRVNKSDARKAWAALKMTDALLTQILEALSWQVTQPNWTKNNGEFIPYPATWLRKGGWTSEPRTPVGDHPATDYDWFVECKALHGNACDGQRAHAQQLILDRGRHAAAS